MTARLLLVVLALSALGMARPPAASPSPTPIPPPSATPAPTPLAFAPDPRPFTDAPDALGISVEGGENEEDPEDNSLTRYTEFRVQFPEAMVAPDRIDATDAPSPIVAWPDLDAEWTWRTQSQGVWRVKGPLIPGQSYRLRLREGLAPLSGQPLAVNEWGYEVETAPIEVTSEWWERETLSAQPQVPLKFNYPVRLADAAAGCWIQNRLTRERFPVEILLNRAVSDVAGDVVDLTTAADQPAPTAFRVRPREPLPVGSFYDLVVDGVADAYGGRPLLYPRVFPLGRTRFYEVDYVVARNWTRDRPHIEVKFRGLLSDAPLPPDAVKVEPAVPNLQLRREGERLLVDGDFDATRRYRVTLSAAITGDRGYPLAKSETWGATFRPREATLFFPEGLIRQRAALGLRFALLQANTGPITWRLARVPLERLTETQTAVRANAADVVAALNLTPVATGELPASTADQEVVRAIEWQPAPDQAPLSGPYVFTAVTRTEESKTLTNNALVFFNETVFTQKTTPAGTIVRLAGMADAKPLAGATVRVVTATLAEITRGVTDETGAVTFPAAALVGSAFFLADAGGVTSIDLTAPGAAFPGTGSTYAAAPPPYRGEIITDRPLYRPGEEVRFKGFLRRNDDGDLVAPAGARLEWRIESDGRSDRVAEGRVTVNAFGGWDAAWTPPAQGRIGGFRITARIGETDAGNTAFFRVEEFRNPPFSVVTEAIRSPRAGESTVQVSSEYFHGAPNVGSRVKWTATWTSDSDGEYYFGGDGDGFQRVDLYSEDRRTPAFDAEVSGETVLDGQGRATITTTSPFRDPGLRAHANVSWRIDVTGPDGQTITGGTTEKVVMNDATLGVRALTETPAPAIAFALNATARDPKADPPAEVNARFFLIRTKSVKERLAPFVYRYRNFDEYVLVEQRTAPANGTLTYSPGTPGRYVLVVSPLAGQPGITVSDEVYLTGEGEAEFPVQSDQALVLKPVVPGENDAPAPVGSTAAFDLLAPSPGVAWITVETDRILDAYTIPVPGNATRVEIPVKPGYAPNVRVSAYLLRPGKSDGLPGEMYHSAELRVARPGAKIDLAVTPDRPEYQPRQSGRVSVRATADGRPVANAEVTLSAVDDAILELGGWFLPHLLPTFLPEHPFTVVTRLALTGYVDGFSEKALTQKGVVVGEGGKDEFGDSRFVRQNFRPRILWMPSLKTNADGVATAAFETPDNLTRFRLVALAQTKENQFGAGDATFTVSQPLLVEPALPRFLRAGDEVELRAVARQKVADATPITLRCEPGPGLTLLGPAEVTRPSDKSQPTVATFRARVAENVPTTAIRFSATAPGDLTDEIDVTLPVAPRTIEVRESLAGPLSGGTFAPAKVAPASWTIGSVDVTLSTSPELTKLLGLPAVLDYPYGCFEQKSSRLLASTALARLLAFLPQPADRRENYGRVITETLAEFEKSLLPDDFLPYWPFGEEGNAFVTIQAAWAVAQAEAAGYAIPENLAAALPRAVRQIALRETRLEVEPTLRAFAFFALAQLGEGFDEDLTAAANELFLHRDRLTDEGRAFLAIALHTAELEPEHQQTLVRELPRTSDARAFNPATFSSAPRAEALAAWARLLVTPDDAASLPAPLAERLADATSLSTQENLWLLVAFNAFLAERSPARLGASLAPPPDARSENGTSAAWIARNLARLGNLTITGAPKSGAYVLAARRLLGPAEQQPVSRGLRLDRIVKNLTDPARTGSTDAPFRLGDQILISFRFHADQAQSYVALEDALPAGLEVLNPNLEMIGRFYQIPDDPGAPAAWLSFAEMRDRQTNLFFDDLSAGAHGYAILARATAAGVFAWPSAQLTPMYDARFYARTAPSTCVVVE